MGVPSVVKPFRNERANAIGSRERANGTDLELGDLTVEVPRAQALAQKFRCADLRFTQCILVSTRLLRWQPLQRRQMVRPKRFDARRASFRAIAPAVQGFYGFAFLRGGMMAAAPRAAMASDTCGCRRHRRR